MKIQLLHAVLFGLIITVVGGFAAPVTATAGTKSLVDSQWLEKNLGAKNLVIIDVRTPTNYGVGHIPGSFNLPYVGWEPTDAQRNCQLMPTPEYFSQMMQAIGVNNNSHVVVYDHGNTLSDATKGCAAVWILESMGHTNVSYLDGGFTKWTFEGRIIDNKAVEAKDGNFAAKLKGSGVAELSSILKMKKGVVLVDARNPEQHFGNSKRADVERFGHIPGSISLPAGFLNHAGINRAPATIKPAKELAEIVKGTGVPADKNTSIIVYCNTGQFAAMNYLVLHDVLGYKNVSVYDGSMLEYASNTKQPMVNFTWGTGR